MQHSKVILKGGRDRSVRLRHPWIFSGAIARIEGTPVDGAPVELLAADNSWLAWGSWSGSSQIRVRIWSWEREQTIDAELIRTRIRRALTGRAALAGDKHTNAYRVIFSEADGLPGLIVDRYGDYLVLQLLTTGAAAHADTIIAALAELIQPVGIYERSDADIRSKEGLPPAEGLRWGAPPPPDLEIMEHGVRYGIDLVGGQKTGAYLDQRDNRVRVAAYCRDADVLSCFSYTGGFELQAALAGAASIMAIDSSTDALVAARQNLRRNGIFVPVEQVEGNVFGELRRLRSEERLFDVIVLDPPRFAGNASQIDRATHGYKDINLLAMQLLRPGGVLATFSCSGLISTDLFQKVIFGAAVDAQRDVQILEQLRQGPDHPVLLSFPESAYLKGLICRVW
ncbi:MAG: class I SAM-dependent methyltransferase [Herpetosiphon sp.]